MKSINYFIFFAVFGCIAHAQDANTPTAADSLPAFRADSSKAAVIRDIEAGKAPTDPRHITAPATPNSDSLDFKLRHRDAFLGITVSFAFADNSAKQLFADYMGSVVVNDTLNVLQPQDPVAIYFPVGLVAAFPIFPYLDAWLRTESFWYRESGLAQKSGAAAQEFWYVTQGDLAGIGARYLVPASLLSVNGHNGLYVSYTQFWNFGPTGMYSSTGRLRAKTEPSGAGYEIQTGFQQSYHKRWTWTGGLAFTNLTLESRSSWSAIIPGGTNEPASWSLKSLRLCLQGFYQFGVRGANGTNGKK